MKELKDREPVAVNKQCRVFSAALLEILRIRPRRLPDFHAREFNPCPRRARLRVWAGCNVCGGRLHDRAINPREGFLDPRPVRVTETQEVEPLRRGIPADGLDGGIIRAIPFNLPGSEYAGGVAVGQKGQYRTTIIRRGASRIWTGGNSPGRIGGKLQ